MSPIDRLAFATDALRGHQMRSWLTAIGIAVGIMAVVLLLSLGAGVQRFLLAEFTQFGTNLIGIHPGKTETFGIPTGAIGSVQALTLDDAEALDALDAVVAVVPLVHGNAEVKQDKHKRRTMVLGVGAHVPEAWQIPVQLGRFLPDDTPRQARSFAVLGAKLRREIFGDVNPLGKSIRVAGERYRVVGVMEPKGQFLGFDLDDTVYIPAAKALELFDREGLMEIDVLYREGRSAERVSASITRVLAARHGREDFTVISQAQMLEILDSVLGVLTAGVAALGGISLFVGGVGIFTIMTIGVHERYAEIGLLRALGARREDVLAVFLLESVVLAVTGGALGVAIAFLIAGVGDLAALPISLEISPIDIGLAVAVATVVGLVAGIGPALRAAGLAPLDALRSE